MEWIEVVVVVRFGSLHRFAIDYTQHLRPKWQGFNFFFNHFISVSIYLHLNLFTRFKFYQIALFIAHIKNCYIFMGLSVPLVKYTVEIHFDHNGSNIHCVVSQFSIIENFTSRELTNTRHSIQQCVALDFQRGCIFIGRLRFEWHKQCVIYTEKNGISISDRLAKAARGCTHTHVERARLAFI